MPTTQKTEIINDLTQKFQSSSGIYFTRYSGMNVTKITELRRKFRENEVSYFVSKNTLTKIAANNAGYEDKLNDWLNGQIGIAYTSGDSAAPARVIRNFEKENKNVTLEVIGLVFEGEIFSAEKVGTIFIDNSQCVSVQFIKVNDLMIELLEPLDNNSPVCTFLDNHGSGGIYHISFKVDDLEQAERDVRNKGGIVISKSKDGWGDMEVMFAMYIKDNEKQLVEYVVTKDNV